MYRSKLVVPVVAVLIGVAVACTTKSSSSTATPTSPGGATALTANSDGSLLKVTAPAPTAPANNSTFDKGVQTTTLTATAATGEFGTVTPTYHFQLFKGGVQVADFPNVTANGSTVAAATAQLGFKTGYTWRVRAELNGTGGPWSATEAFTTGEVVQPRRDANAYGGKIPRSVALADLNATVYSVAAAYPDAVDHTCNGSRNDYSFPEKLLTVLRQQYDNRWGFNCIRGNCSDPSAKIVDYHYSPGPSEGTTNVYIFQVVAGNCSPEALDQTQPTLDSGNIGRWTLFPGQPGFDRTIFMNLVDY